MRSLIMSIGLTIFFILLSQVIAQESSVATRQYLDYFATHLRMTQQKLLGQDNHATVVAFEGELNRAYLVNSLKSLFQAHPNLRVKKIKYDDQKKRFYVDNELAFSEISCEFVEIESEEDWQQIVDEQLSHPFPLEGPYWKVCCLSVKNSKPVRHYLIQFFDHSLCDGISTAKLNDELFTYYNALTNQKKIEVVEDSPPDSVAALYSPEQQCSWQDYKSKQDQLSKLYPIPSQGATYEKQTSLQQRRTKAILFAFEMEPIYQVCKENGLTVNDLLVATSLLALRSNKSFQADMKPFDTSVLTCVNLRNPKIGLADWINVNSLACLFNIIILPQKIEATSTIWTIAESYRKLSTIFINQLAQPPVDFSIEEMCERYGLNLTPNRKYFAGGIAVSNLGRIDLKKKYGNIDIIFYQFFTNQGAGFFEALLDVSCVENTIHCNITYVEPLHSRKWALQLISQFIHELNLVLHNRLTLIENCTDKDVLEAVRYG